MSRARLPNRRQNETIDLSFAGSDDAVTIGFFDDGRVGEVFVHGAKIGSQMDAILADACVAVSLLLQHGVEPAAFAHSMGRAGDRATPASIIGALADLVATPPPEAQQPPPKPAWVQAGAHAIPVPGEVVREAP